MGFSRDQLDQLAILERMVEDLRTYLKTVVLQPPQYHTPTTKPFSYQPTPQPPNSLPSTAPSTPTPPFSTYTATPSKITEINITTTVPKIHTSPIPPTPQITHTIFKTEIAIPTPNPISNTPLLLHENFEVDNQERAFFEDRGRKTATNRQDHGALQAEPLTGKLWSIVEVPNFTSAELENPNCKVLECRGQLFNNGEISWASHRLLEKQDVGRLRAPPHRFPKLGGCADSRSRRIGHRLNFSRVSRGDGLGRRRYGGDWELAWSRRIAWRWRRTAPWWSGTPVDLVVLDRARKDGGGRGESWSRRVGDGRRLTEFLFWNGEGRRWKNCGLRFSSLNDEDGVFVLDEFFSYPYGLLYVEVYMAQYKLVEPGGLHWMGWRIKFVGYLIGLLINSIGFVNSTIGLGFVLMSFGPFIWIIAWLIWVPLIGQSAWICWFDFGL